MSTIFPILGNPVIWSLQFLIGQLQPCSQAYDLASYTIYVLCVHLITRLRVSDFFQKPYMTFSYFLSEFMPEICWERKLPKKYFFVFRFLRDVWPTFDTVKEFIYLGCAVTTENDVNLEIKRMITLANRCYYGLNGQLSNRDLSRTTKLILYKIRAVFLYGAEAWTLLSTDAAALREYSVRCELAMISAFDSIVSCMSSSTT